MTPRPVRRVGPAARRRSGCRVADDIVEMTRGDGDWWTPGRARPGPVDVEVDYGYLIDDRTRRCPTRGRGVSRRASTSAREPSTHGRSRWTDGAWTGRQLAGSVIYELHVGTFTPEGTFDAALGKLDHLRGHRRRLRRADAGQRGQRHPQLGLRRRAVVRGPRAVRRPGGYQRFVDGCHAAGLGVIQDVVHNHLGPSGQLPAAVRALPQGRGATPGATWSTSTATGSAEVRRYILDNVRMWLEDYHVDGLRLDAVHALDGLLAGPPARGDGDRGGRAVGPPAPAADPDRGVRPQRPAAGHAARGRRLRPRRAVERRLPPRRPRRADRRDRAATTPTSSRSSALAKVCERGFFHDGTCSSFRGPRPRRADRHRPRCRPGGWSSAARTTTRSATAPPATGSPTHLDDDQLACAALLTLAGPFTPMLFQGEEWAASTPFQFFTSHPEPEPGAGSTAEGRIEEFDADGLGPRRRARPAGPGDLRALEAGLVGARSPGGTPGCWRPTAGWPSCGAPHPDLTDPSFGSTSCTADEETRVFRMRRGGLLVVVNFGDEPGDRAGRSRRGPAVRHRRGRGDRASGRLVLPAARRRPGRAEGARRTVEVMRRRYGGPRGGCPGGRARGGLRWPGRTADDDPACRPCPRPRPEAVRASPPRSKPRAHPGSAPTPAPAPARAPGRTPARSRRRGLGTRVLPTTRDGVRRGPDHAAGRCGTGSSPFPTPCPPCPAAASPPRWPRPLHAAVIARSTWRPGCPVGAARARPGSGWPSGDSTTGGTPASCSSTRTWPHDLVSVFDRLYDGAVPAGGAEHRHPGASSTHPRPATAMRRRRSSAARRPGARRTPSTPMAWPST